MNISYSNLLKKYFFPLLLLFFMNDFLFFKSEANSYLVESRREENLLEGFYSDNSITYNEYDKVESQLKLLFGHNIEPPNNYYYPDLSIIDYSDTVRDSYLKKLNDMTINKIIYNIKNEPFY